jgi:hypothetical protein
MKEVTRILDAIERGDSKAADALLPLPPHSFMLTRDS